jgi:hypothetical protein
MRPRSLLALCASAVLAAVASAGVFDSFVAVLDARAQDPSLRRNQVRALDGARSDVTSADLLLSQTRAARSAERRLRAAFPRLDPVRSAAGQTPGALTAALDIDARTLEARRGTLGDEAAERRLQRGVELARRDLIRAARLKSAPAVLNSLVAASVHLRDAFPPQPEAAMPDVNPVSSTKGQTYTVRGFAGRISAWYFIHTT